MLTPRAIDSEASAQMRSTALASPSGPSAAGQVMSSVCASKTAESTWRSFSSSGVAQDRRLHRELVRVLGRLVEQVALRADAGGDAHHQRLADRVDRRVGDLREELLEVGEQRRLAVGEHGEREVVAHRADRLLGAWPPSAPAAPAGPPGCSRTRAGGRAAARCAGRAARARAGRRGGRRPARTTRRRAAAVATARLTSSSATIRPASTSTRNSLPGCSRPLRTMLAAGSSITPVSEAEHDPAVLGLQPAPRAQAVAVERRADHAAVGEGDRRGPVPRLHQAGVERVEAPEVLGQVVAALVGLRDHHHHRVRQRAAREHEQLEHVVERRGVRAAGAHDRQHLRAGRPRRTARRRAATRGRASS